MKRLIQLRTLLSSAVTSTLILSAAFSHADDTEVFFGGPAIDDSVKPNVLFILDNSGSMNWRLDSNNTATGSQQSRMMVLKDAFSDIMSNTSNINVGVMVLNPRAAYGNTRYVYPVEYIDKELGGDVELVAGVPNIRQSSDDATQAISPLGSAVVDNPNLIMGVIDTTQPLPNQASSILGTTGSFFRLTSGGTEYACRLSPPSRPGNAVCTNSTMTDLNLRRSQGTMALFHFQGLNIPANATITNAYIEITPTNSPAAARRNPLINVQLQNNKTPAPLNDSNPVGTRTYQTAANIQANGWISGNRVAIDITSQFNTLKSAAPTGDPVQGMFVRLTNTSTSNENAQDYTFCANNCSTGNAPSLVVNYTVEGLAPESRMGALRFQDVSIPQGATVTSARIDFFPSAANNTPVTFEVRAERTGDASTFTNGSNLQTRAKTTAVSTWTPAPWTSQATPEPIPGPDVTALVQEVVNLGSWCGNNSMAFHITPTAGTGSRSAHSFDGAGGLQPVLTLSYTGGKDGCFNPIIEARVTTNANDGYQNNSGTVTLNQNSLPLSRNQLGIRFENLPIARGTSVMKAEMVMTPSSTVTSPNQVSRISFQNSATATAFQATSNNLSNRTTRTSESDCNINSSTGWVSGQPVTCDISSLNGALTSIFANSAWDRGNALNMFVRHTTDTSLQAVAFEDNPGQSIKLRLKLSSGGLVTTVRSHVNALVQNMTAADGTPIVPTYLDAVRYMRNEVSGRPSPIDSACQANHIVLLTDGQANNNTTAAKNAIASLTGLSCSNDASDDGERCARTLARWITENDQSSLEGNHYITTHTVGFALDASGTTASNQIKTFLREVASNGGGSFSTAENAGELSDAFNRIIQEVLATDTTFVSATAPANTFNRQDNKDELYFSLFRPSETDRWPGNLKRYRMATANGAAFIVDADGIPAIDANTGFFRSDSRSFWSADRDGGSIVLGGAASRLPASGSRLLLTNVTPNSNALTAIATGNTALTADKFGAANADERSELISYIRGLDPATNNERRALGDPLHATPSLVTYACNTYDSSRRCTNEDQGVVIGSNEGFIQLFDTSNGVERFAFMPEPLLANVRQLRLDAKSTTLKPRRYGMDNTVVVWANDVNGNGVIYGGVNPADRSGPLLTGLNPNEFVYAYATMGRGGRDIYALDITNRNSPQLLWKIQGGVTAGFEQLGQTWSAPVRTKIQVGSTIKDVLIFGGGYDPNQDNVSERTVDTMGNAVYIVDAVTGAKIWSASSAAGHDATLSRMRYSIPSRVSVIGLRPDANGNAVIDSQGLAGQFFVGDMGGQIWRFHINNGSSGASLVSPAGSGGNGVFADVGGAGTAAARRFYHEAELALLNVGNTRVLTVNIGSGYRGHPLDKNIQDRFYSFRTDKLIKGTASESTFTEGSLYDATANLAQTGNATEKAAAEQQFSSTNGGWYIRLTAQGEKVLSRPLVADGMVLFSTYEPRSNSNSCKASLGISRAYTVMLKNAAAISTTRYVETNATSLPSNPQIYCAGNACWVYHDPSQLVPTPTGGNNPPDACATSANPEKCRCDNNPQCIWMPVTPRLYWIDEE